MFLLISILSFYCLNMFILFQGQSLVLLLAFSLLCVLIKNLYTKLESTSFQLELLEWIENMQFLVLLKCWYMFSIRLLNVKLYNFYIFVRLLNHELNAIMEEFFSILNKLYMHQIQLNALWNLERLYHRKKKLKVQDFDFRYIMSLNA